METKSQVTASDTEAGACGKRRELSVELWSILLVGAALAALMLTGMGEIREDMREIREDMRERFSSMEDRLSSMEGRLSSMEARLAVVEREQGEIRGLLESRRNTAAGVRESAGTERNGGPGQVRISHQPPAEDAEMAALITHRAARDAPHP